MKLNLAFINFLYEDWGILVSPAALTVYTSTVVVQVPAENQNNLILWQLECI